MKEVCIFLVTTITAISVKIAALQNIKTIILAIVVKAAEDIADPMEKNAIRVFSIRLN